MTSPRWTPIRRALEARREQLEELVRAPHDGDGNGKDEGDRAVASLRHEEVTATKSRARERLVLIADALKRLDDGTFGKCVDCDGEISLARLTVLLTVDTCIACATKRESQRPAFGHSPYPADSLEC